MHEIWSSQKYCNSFVLPVHFQNSILEDAFSADLGWKLLDAYSPTVLRADMHTGGNDCLHYCVVGSIVREIES